MSFSRKKWTKKSRTVCYVLGILSDPSNELPGLLSSFVAVLASPGSLNLPPAVPVHDVNIPVNKRILIAGHSCATFVRIWMPLQAHTPLGNDVLVASPKAVYHLRRFWYYELRFSCADARMDCFDCPKAIRSSAAILTVWMIIFGSVLQMSRRAKIE